jgi:Flp pilus assembly protein protease CpaA
MLIVSFFIIKSDIYKRKISNRIIIFLLFILIFNLFINYKNINFSVFLLEFLFSLFLGFFLFIKKIWGAADGKLFIVLSLLIGSLFNYNSYIDYILNLIFIYSLTLLVLIIFFTRKRDKLIAIKKLNKKLDFVIFYVMIVFFIITLFYYIISNYLTNLNNKSLILLSLFFIVLFIFMSFINKYLKKIWKKLNQDQKLFIIVFLFLIFLLFSRAIFVTYFIITILIKSFIDIFISLSDKIYNEKEKKFYYSPFGVYLILVFLMTIILQNNVFLILIKFIFFFFY